MSGIEVAGLVITLIHITGKLLKVTGQFSIEAKSAGDRSSDLLAQVILLNEILPQLHQTVERRQTRTKWQSVAADEQGLLNSLWNILKSLETTLSVFEEKVEALGNGSGGWQNVKTQLRLMMSGDDIGSLENRISSEVSMLQLMMTCYLWYDKSADNLPDEGMAFEIARGINVNMRYIKEQLNRVTSLLPEDTNAPNHSTCQIGAKADQGIEMDNSAEWLDLRMMLNCCQSADAMVKNYSRAPSLKGVDEGSTGLSPTLHGDVARFDLELMTMLITGYRKRAEEDLRKHAYQSAEINLRRAIHQARQREEHYEQPFEERYELETMLAKAYIHQSKFEEAVTTLRSLRPLAETCTKSSAELGYQITDLCRRRYQATESPQHFREWDENALKAYNLARTLASIPEFRADGNTLVTHAARIMIELYEIKKDPVGINTFRKRHPETLFNSDHVEASYRANYKNSSSPSPSSFVSQDNPISRTTTRESSLASPRDSLSGLSLQSQTSVLFESIYNEDMERIKDILAQNTDVTAETDSHGRTPLMCAVKLRNMPLVKILLRRSPINVRDNDGKTVLHYALSPFNRRGMLEPIIQHEDINPSLLNACDSDGLTALHYCVTNQRLDGAYDLIAHGASLDIRDKADDTPASLAESEGSTDFERLFRLAKERVYTEGFQSMSVDHRCRFLRQLAVGGNTRSTERRSMSVYGQDNFRPKNHSARKGSMASSTSSSRGFSLLSRK